MAELTSERLRLWEYSVSHCMALFRRPAGNDAKDNLDLVFADVEYFEAATALDGVSIQEGSPVEFAELRKRIPGLSDRGRLFVLTTRGTRFRIVATEWVLETNRRELFDSGIRPYSPTVERQILASARDHASA